MSLVAGCGHHHAVGPPTAPNHAFQWVAIGGISNDRHLLDTCLAGHQHPEQMGHGMRSPFEKEGSTPLDGVD